MLESELSSDRKHYVKGTNRNLGINLRFFLRFQQKLWDEFTLFLRHSALLVKLFAKK